MLLVAAAGWSVCSQVVLNLGRAVWAAVVSSGACGSVASVATACLQGLGAVFFKVWVFVLRGHVCCLAREQPMALPRPCSSGLVLLNNGRL